MAEKLEGGSFGGVDDLYREVILEHFKSPRNKGELSSPNITAEGVNPLCGDQITIHALMDGDRIKDLKFQGHGCAISQSSASIMTQLIKGKSLAEAREITKAFKHMFGIDVDKNSAPPLSPDDLGDLIALEGVKKFPVRIKCALLSWNTLKDGLDNFKKKAGT